MISEYVYSIIDTICLFPEINCKAIVLLFPIRRKGEGGVKYQNIWLLR
jgi:hypothetical protein